MPWIPHPLATGDVPWCEQWITGAEVKAALPLITDAQADDAALAATGILFELSGHVFTGLCTQTVTPTSGTCRPYYGPRMRGLLLPGSPVHSVGQVRDGTTVIDSTTYWLEGQLLVNAPMGLGVEVDYTFGESIPEAAVDAALALAIELVNASTGGACALPDSVTQIARDGITYTKPAIQELRTLGMTGIGEVDRFLRAYNPNGLTLPPMIITPGSRRTRRIA